MTEPDGRQDLSRIELIRISLYWLALSGLWAGLGLQLQPVIAQHFICPTGVEPSACATLPLASLTPAFFGVRLRPEVAIGVIGLIGSVVAFVVQPLAAALSDYTRSRLGRRRPWILAGTAMDVVFLVALANSQTFLAFAVLITLLQFSSNLAQGPFQGYVPDLVPERQVGTASGLVGMMQIGGQLLGAGVAGAAVALDQIPLGILGLAFLEVATMVPAVFGVADRPVEMPRRTGSAMAGIRGALAEAWGHRSFVWLLGSRMLILMTTGTLVAEAEFFLTRSTGYTIAEAATAILILLAITVLSAAVVAVWAGPASDRLGRRQVIWISCAIGAVGMLGMALAPALPELAFSGIRFPIFGLAAVPVGVGAGMFLAVDWALMVDIVPKATAGRYMGISNVVTATSGAFAGAIGGGVIALVTGLTGDAGLGPRVAFALTLLLYAGGAWALRRVDPRPFDVQMAARRGDLGAVAVEATDEV
ncbi:MAG: MFS transporter [Candidatus Limnocylindrales bacterium]